MNLQDLYLAVSKAIDDVKSVCVDPKKVLVSMQLNDADGTYRVSDHEVEVMCNRDRANHCVLFARNKYGWKHNTHPDRTADQGCSVEGVVEICETCEGTGWYGDNGSGVLENSEFHECDCCDHSKVEKCSCGWHKYLVVGGVAWCEECNREADLSVCRLFHPPFNMEFNNTSQNVPTQTNNERRSE